MYTLCTTHPQVPSSGSTAEAILTLPGTSYMSKAMNRTAVFLHTGTGMGDFKGRLPVELSTQLADQGFATFRLANKVSDKLRDEMFVAGMNLAASCPYFEGVVDRWVVVAHSAGARIAATHVGDVRATIAGCIFSTYLFTGKAHARNIHLRVHTSHDNRHPHLFSPCCTLTYAYIYTHRGGCRGMDSSSPW